MSVKVKSRLGRGLSSLLSSTELPIERDISQAPAQPPAGEPAPMQVTAEAAFQAPANAVEAPRIEVAHLELASIIPNPMQPRRSFDPASITELARSLKTSGIIQPIVVCISRAHRGKFELVAGERRWRAATEAGLATIPAIVRLMNAYEQARLALVENIHREDLNPIDRAIAYRTLLENAPTLTQEQLAEELGEQRSTVSNLLRLLILCDAVQAMVSDGRLSLGHAKLLVGVPDILLQQKLATQAVSQGLSVRQLEELMKADTPASPPRPTPPGSSAHLLELESNLSRQLGLRVQVRAGQKKGKGRLVLHYANLDQFDELLNKLGVTPE